MSASFFTSLFSCSEIYGPWSEGVVVVGHVQFPISHLIALYIVTYIAFLKHFV